MRFALFFLLLASPAFAYVDEGKPPLVQFSPYKPNFFIFGKDNAKVQFSFKARPTQAIPLYLAYTQLMLWNIFSRSAPMEDINYNPEVFYRWQLGDSEALSWLDFEFFEHESNGVDGDASRSWNRGGLRYSSVIHLPNSPQYIQWSVKAWVPYATENVKRWKYRGFMEFNFTLENPFGDSIGENDITLRYYPGGASGFDPIHGGQELTLRVRPVKKNYLPLIMLQLFHGYGEFMLKETEEVLGFRAGIGF